VARAQGGELDAYEDLVGRYTAAAGVVWAEVDGQPAIWIPTPHPVTYIDRDGVRHDETARPASATLIWQSTAVTYRLEGQVTADEALAIARSPG